MLKTRPLGRFMSITNPFIMEIRIKKMNNYGGVGLEDWIKADVDVCLADFVPDINPSLGSHPSLLKDLESSHQK